ncbi:hypothetical protein CTEN210_11918 [Chaetoceros tenuissimus]|uniref:Ankyrin repeat-containing protein n=1 Tax=Chaetoceros tenuissimus TaxID=426638 RepID=A0AAD3H9C8_9STRA|nr:hypothetical protein CTEN210_11918 [Chaetoceros tenuissimus]
MESLKKRQRLTKDELVVSSSKVDENNHEQISTTTTRSSSNRFNSLRSKLIDLSDDYPELNDIKEFPMILSSLKIKEHRYENEEKCPLYKLPQDLFNKCLSFLDKSYGSVAPVSKHFYESYIMTFDASTETRADFEGLSKEAGVYLVESFPHEFSSEEHRWSVGNFFLGFRRTPGLTFTFTDYLMHKAARQGNLEVYKHFLENGHDLLRAQGTNWNLFRKLGENGHLHILQYLQHEQYFYRGFCYSAIGASKGGRVDIIEWIHNEIGCFSNERAGNLIEECIEEALEHGQIEVIKWFDKHFEYEEIIIERVVATANLNSIKFYIEKYWPFPWTQTFAEELGDTIIETESIDIIKYFVENGIQFTTESTRIAAEIENDEMLKYLISIGIELRLDDIPDYGMDSFEMMKFKFEKTRVWWNNASIVECMKRHHHDFSIKMLRYLHENNCPWEPLQDPTNTTPVFGLLEAVMRLKDMDILKYVVHKMSDILGLKDNILIVALDYGWVEGFKYTIQNLDGCSLPSLNDATFTFRQKLDFLKYCKSEGMKWVQTSNFPREILEISNGKDCELLKWVTSDVDVNLLRNSHILKFAKCFDFRHDVLEHFYNAGFLTKDALIIAIEDTQVKAVKALVEIGFKVDEDIFSCALRSFDCVPTDKDIEILSFLVRKRCLQKKVFA